MSWQTADCTAMMPHIICWVDELICGDHYVTAGELCSTQSTNKGSVMGIIEECNYSKVWACLLPWMLTDAQKDNESDFHWSFASIWECRWGLPFAHCHGLEIGSIVWTQIQASVDWMVNYQVEISRLQTWGMRKLLYLWTFWLVVITVNWPLYWHSKRSMSAHLHWVHPKWNMSEMLFLHDARPHKHTRIIEIITNFRCSIAASTVQSRPCTIILSPVLFLGKKKNACEDTIMPMMSYCRVPCTSGCREGITTFTRQEYTLLFRVGRRLSTRWKLHWKITLLLKVM